MTPNAGRRKKKTSRFCTDPLYLLVYGALLCMPWHRALALIPPTGVCELTVMLPFTMEWDRTGKVPPMSSSLMTQSRIYSLGYSHLAAAVMAMEHFNARDGSVTPEVAELTDCTIQFAINTTLFLDTGSIGLLGNQLIFENHRERDTPLCGFAGPYFDIPAHNIATMAAAAQVPHVPHGGYNIGLTLGGRSPMTTTPTPDIVMVSRALVLYLLRIKRDNFIAFLHPLTDFGVQAALAFGVACQAFGINQWEEYAFLPPVFYETDDVDRKISTQMKRVKDRGFRTIVINLEAFVVELPALADAAEALNMLNGEYVFVFVPVFQMAAIHNAIQLPDSILTSQGLPSYSNVTKLLRGAALVVDVEGFQYLGDSDSFQRVWKEQDATLVTRINEDYVNRTTQQGKKDLLMPPSYFQSYGPEVGSGKLYDAIMAIGIGACNAAVDSETGIITGESHVNAIRSVEFTGGSGNVAFGNLDVSHLNSKVRRSNTATFGVYNMYPPSIYNSNPDANRDSSFDEAFVLTEMVTGIDAPQTINQTRDTGEWTQYGPIFVYADGRVEPPELLRDIPEQNYLSKGLRIVGLTMMAVCLFCCAISMAFVLMNLQHRVVRASQPMWLCILLTGAAISSLAILPASFDESYGWDEDALSAACIATPWLFCIGHIVTYGALFCKLWRVNKVLQFTRRKISASAVAGPLVVLIFATVVLLTAWTIHDPPTWVRFELDDVTGESIGQCQSDSMMIYVPLLVVVMTIPALLTAIMAWKTRDVDATFTESSWIFTLIVLQTQIIMVSIPIVIILRSISTDGRYMGLVLLIWTFPASTVTFIMGPKFVAYFDKGSSVSSRSSGARRSRGVSSQGAVHVSGVSGLSGATSEGKHHSSQMEAAFVGDRDSEGKRVSFGIRVSGGTSDEKLLGPELETAVKRESITAFLDQDQNHNKG